jgi:ATP-dependent Clp protease adaptor protein ClpS
MSAQQAAAETATPQTAQPKRETRPRTDTQPQQQPRYTVILLNDDDHTYEYVIEMLQSLFAHPPETGFLLAREVDTQGRAIVLTTTFEHAELKRDQIHAYGRDARISACKGSMSAIIEPAPGEQ